MRLPPRRDRVWFALCLLGFIAVLSFGRASAMEFVCDGADGGQTRLGARDRAIVVVSRDADGGGCRFSVDGYPTAGPSTWALDLVYGDRRTSDGSGELFVYDVMLRSQEQASPIDLATLLLSAGGYGASDDAVGHDAVQEFAARHLGDSAACVSLIEFAGADMTLLESGFCGYLLAGGEQGPSPVAAALRDLGIRLPPQYDEGGMMLEQLYFVYVIDTGSTAIAAFFPAEP